MTLIEVMFWKAMLDPQMIQEITKVMLKVARRAFNGNPVLGST